MDGNEFFDRSQEVQIPDYILQKAEQELKLIAIRQGEK